MHSRKHQISNPVEPSVAVTPAARPDLEVVPAAKRRTCSNAEKPRILAAADASQAPGEIGALLRREGIYSSHLATWRKQRQAAAASQVLERKRDPKVAATAAQDRKVCDLEAEVARLRDKLAKADLIIDVQKNFHLAGTEHHRHAERAEVISAAEYLTGEVGVAAACPALQLPRSALYRYRTAQRVCSLPPVAPAAPARRPPLALSEHERRVVLQALYSRALPTARRRPFMPDLLDEGRYVASVRTMYRLRQGCAAVRTP